MADENRAAEQSLVPASRPDAPSTGSLYKHIVPHARPPETGQRHRERAVFREALERGGGSADTISFGQHQGAQDIEARRKGTMLQKGVTAQEMRARAFAYAAAPAQLSTSTTTSTSSASDSVAGGVITMGQPACEGLITTASLHILH